MNLNVRGDEKQIPDSVAIIFLGKAQKLNSSHSVLSPTFFDCYSQSLAQKPLLSHACFPTEAFTLFTSTILLRNLTLLLLSFFSSLDNPQACSSFPLPSTCSRPQIYVSRFKMSPELSTHTCKLFIFYPLNLFSFCLPYLVNWPTSLPTPKTKDSPSSSPSLLSIA